MQLDDLVGDESQRSYVIYVVWTLFVANRDDLTITVLWLTIDISRAVEQWISKFFGPDPVTASSSRTRLRGLHASDGD